MKDSLIGRIRNFFKGNRRDNLSEREVIPFMELKRLAQEREERGFKERRENPLIKKFRDSSLCEKKRIALMLARMQTDDALEELKYMTNRGSYEEQLIGVWALGEIGRGEALKFLEGMYVSLIKLSNPPEIFRYTEGQGYDSTGKYMELRNKEYFYPLVEGDLGKKLLYSVNEAVVSKGGYYDKEEVPVIAKNEEAHSAFERAIDKLKARKNNLL